jgi:hypothetical protein
MADTSNLLACTYGTSNLVVVSYSVRETANLDKTTGVRIGTFVRVEADCEVRGTDPASYASDLQAIEVDLRVDGRDFTITGLNNTVEYFIPASGSIDAGPHCGFEMRDGESALSKKIKLIVTTQQSSQGNSSTPTNSFDVKTATGPDGLQTISQTGTLTGVATSSYFLSTILPAFQRAYSAGQPNSHWTVSATMDAATTGTSNTLKYTMTAKQLFGPLPSVEAATAVEGTMSQQIACDEHYRKTTTYEFNLLIWGGGDPVQLLTSIRPTSGVILREGYKIETIKENRLSGSFTLLSSNDPKNAPLMNYQQTARLQIPPTLWEEKTYIGAAPILVQAPQRMPRVTQTGSAVAAGAFYKGAQPLYPTLTAPKEISITDQNDFEKSTSWSFDMIATTFTPGDGTAPGGPALADLSTFDASQIGRNQVDNGTGAYFPGVTPPASGTDVSGSGSGDGN